MHQVLFWLPIKVGIFPNGIPVYGFGMMLFLSFIVCTALVTHLAKREGFNRDRIYDLAFWVFIGGIVGARIVFMIHFKVPFENIYKIWEGGIEFYGSAVGGWVGYGLGWLWLRYRQRIRISTWKLADVVAPVVCVGLAIGRVGCLLNGCCYGHVCPDCGVRFPTLTAPARELVVFKEGYQTAAGFSIDDQNVLAGRDVPATVGAIEPGSPAAEAGLRPGDVIEQANDQPIGHLRALRSYFLDGWPRGLASLSLTIKRDGQDLTLPAFTPKTLPLHPTQLYETISMTLLFFLLMAFMPFRRHYGEAFVLLMVGYAFHRFFNETLRNDTDPVVANLTLSQVGSIAVLAAGVALWVYLWRSSQRIAPAAPAEENAYRRAERV